MRLGAKARIRQPRLPTVVWEVTKGEPGRSWTWLSSLTRRYLAIEAAGLKQRSEQAAAASRAV